ncbi:MAG: C4-type zinc ribbon domain-containing protein [Bacteroidota bacterium]|nr:C4-type zinc ribbon domain-containing protein [Bacteroidota bacterium]
MAGKSKNLSTEEKLIQLYELQANDSQIDEIKNLRGSLPLEVKKLEEDIKEVEAKISDAKETTKSLEKSISDKKNEAKEAEGLIKKYKEQQMNVRNNREFDSLSKEVEYQTLEIQLCEKRTKEYKIKIEENNVLISSLAEAFNDKNEALKIKENELNEIISKTKGDEEKLIKSREKLSKQIPERLYTAYSRIRNRVPNGKAVVKVERTSCGGCYSKVPPQRELDIAAMREIIFCEQCGRLLVSPAIDGEEEE